MKKIVMMVVLAAAMTGFAAEAPAAEQWQRDNKTALAAATTDDALAAHVADDAAAAALLANVKMQYGTDPLKAFTIAAVTQYVMRPQGGCPFLRALAFWNWFADTGRDVWTRELLAAAGKATATDVKMYYLDQLRWCGYAGQADEVRKMGAASNEKALRDFAEWVAGELDNSALVRAGF